MRSWLARYPDWDKPYIAPITSMYMYPSLPVNSAMLYSCLISSGIKLMWIAYISWVYFLLWLILSNVFQLSVVWCHYRIEHRSSSCSWVCHTSWWDAWYLLLPCLLLILSILLLVLFCQLHLHLNSCHFLLTSGSSCSTKCLYSHIIPVVSSSTAIAWWGGNSFVVLDAIVDVIWVEIFAFLVSRCSWSIAVSAVTVYILNCLVSNLFWITAFVFYHVVLSLCITVGNNTMLWQNYALVWF